MIGSYKHKRSKNRSMLYFFRVCQNCSDKDRFGSTMHMKMGLMEHMEVDLLVDIGQIYLTQ